MTRTDVLIAGAGPTGLVLALWLAKLGVQVRIVDTTAGPGTTSRAVAVQARTLELYRQLGLDREVVARGHKVPGVNLWVAGERKARMGFESVGQDLTPYSFLEIFPQDEHERLLIQRLEDAGVRVERRTELVSFEDHGETIVARLRQPDGGEESCEARYLAGCDGAHSTVRHALGIGFPGGDYRQLFYVADVDASGPAADGELHIDLDEADFLAVFPLDSCGRVRLIGSVRDDRAEHADTLAFADVSRRAIENLKVEVGRVNWFSTYHVHHRVAERFRQGRAFLLGDAAHIHSPAGGQGMNTGIGDAINLAWKLAAAVHGQARETLLDSYEDERIGFARRLVATTDRVFTFATAEGRTADLLRTRIAPVVLPAVIHVEAAREYLFRMISQIVVDYRAGPLSRGAAGHVHGGDRLPWAPAEGEDNFDTFGLLAWQAHVYGAARPELAAWCAEHHLPLHVFDWRPEHHAAGLARDALYLLRPDSYVALADPSASPDSLGYYAADHGLRFEAGERPASA